MPRKERDGAILHFATNNLPKIDAGRQPLDDALRKHIRLIDIAHEVTQGGHVTVSAICPRTDE